MGTSGTFGGSKNGLVPSWVDEPASPPAAAPDNAESDSTDGDGKGGPDQNGEAPAGPAPAQAYPPMGVDKTWGSCGAFSVCDGQPTIENCGPCDGYLVSPFGRPTHPSALSHAGIGDVID